MSRYPSSSSASPSPLPGATGTPPPIAALVRELGRRGHDVLFLERDVPWYAANRDLPAPPAGEHSLWRAGGTETLIPAHREADLVIVGSYLPKGWRSAEWVLETARGMTAFYDIDTPITLAGLPGATCEYLSAELIPRFNLYLSFTGGPTLLRWSSEFGARRRAAAVLFRRSGALFSRWRRHHWDLGYLGHLQPRPPAGLDRAPAQAGHQLAGKGGLSSPGPVSRMP